MEGNHWSLRLKSFNYAYHQILYVCKGLIKKVEYLNVTTKEDINNDPNEQANQGHQKYIEVWFQKINKMEHHSLLQHFLISSKSKNLVSNIQVHVKEYVLSLHMSLSITLLCTWLHWKYSYT